MYKPLLLLFLLLPSSLPFLLLPLAPLPTKHSSSTSSPTALNTWFFGGTPRSDDDRDQCELVAVKIERTSANSRRIGGEITVDGTIEDVWSILTDYDHLSTHVPNLVESKTVPSPNPVGPGRRRLYQKGAQKIVGFEFGASVEMDMEERFYDEASLARLGVKEMRKILFKCVSSQFFSTFDGEWKLEYLPNTPIPQTRVTYVVDVRPKGPVPVIALEWRIREDVPTNLRSVKIASEDVGEEGVKKLRALRGNAAVKPKSVGSVVVRQPTKVEEIGSRRERAKGRVKDFVQRFGPRANAQWAEDETMAAYLEKEPVYLEKEVQ
ncbi:hypothetical protein TL16_g09190 [Triparma laevis f. inornata]|uniref:Coenzyme Q-binding protein COQ10 START domain-containing protein n=2 Tax=Triparma laevis TaxID=1534972 RepID=A0A9W7E4M5_9STRA|nr:hypothetical protein TrLO_g5194 [Triparma laevis f. longispina]GMH82230.1 hypothetical protein TL16_g09190 [Triparma laevis f. inornata]